METLQIQTQKKKLGRPFSKGYTCNKCNYKTNRSFLMKRHMLRTTSCAPKTQDDILEDEKKKLYNLINEFYTTEKIRENRKKLREIIKKIYTKILLITNELDEEDKKKYLDAFNDFVDEVDAII